MKIGFIGLRIMGSRMAVNLQNHGYSLIVFNRTRAKAEPLLGPCGTFPGLAAKSIASQCAKDLRRKISRLSTITSRRPIKRS